MTEDEAIEQLRMIALSQAIGHFTSSDVLIQAGLDALLAGADTPSLPLLAGLGRREGPEAHELFDQVVEELGFTFEELPPDAAAARWTVAYVLAEQISEGFLDPAEGADLIWVEAALELGYPVELRPFVQCAMELADWDEEWSRPVDEIRKQALQAAREFLDNRPPTTT
ncbi:hypothetical protein AB0M29_24130 [Streptomyces sp. NPDC051976]|uniref:hypothetical protein n=1 Tax=Streptomyces sp. NPDC051976 TaxID=3154947 RepID=UPI003434B539